MANTSGKYHITAKGEVALCRAYNHCPLSQDGHYDTQEAGSKAFEKKMTAQLVPKAKVKHQGKPRERSVVANMVAHAASGAAGVHADQKTKKVAAGGRTTRVGSRSAQKRAIIKDFE